MLLARGDMVLAPQEFTQLLVNWRNGDKSALDEMTPILYEELRRVARRLLSAERPDHTLQPTALVHEAYLRLIGQRAVDWRNRAHFLGVAATMMRRILITMPKRTRPLNGKVMRRRSRWKTRSASSPIRRWICWTWIIPSTG